MGYKRQVALTYVVRIVLIPVGVLYSIVTARWLGPSGLGIFAAIGAVLGTASQLGSLGLPVAVSRFSAEDEEKVPALIANARVIGALTGAAIVVVLAMLYALFPAAFGEVPRNLMLVAALALPLSFASSQFQAVLLGRQRVREYNFMEGMDRVLALAVAFVVLVMLGLGLPALIVMTVVTAAFNYLVYHAVLWPESARLRPDPGLARSMGRFTGKVYLATLLSFLVLRSDILLINGMLGSDPTGLYSVAVRPIDFLLMLPAVAGTLLFPRIAASGGDRQSAQLTATVARHVALIMLATCTVVAAVAWWVVPALFGAEYQGSVIPLWILLPGALCMSVQSILGNDLAGRDYPLAIVWIWTVLLVTNVGLNLIWIPRYGIAGAAASSTVAYALSLFLMGRYWLKRFPEVRAIDLLRITADELRSLGDTLTRPFRSGPDS
jgi:O-antigen/teichoic acid export membrane protein